MSLAYCFDCLERIDQCTCGNKSDKIIYGENRVSYERGYRDALKEEEYSNYEETRHRKDKA